VGGGSQGTVGASLRVTANASEQKLISQSQMRFVA